MLDACEKSAAIQLTQCDEAQNRNHEAADQQTDTVDGIRVCNGLQTAEYGVAHTDNTGCEADNQNCPEVADAEHVLNAEDLLQCDSAGVQNGRQHGDDIREQEHYREHTLGERVIAHLVELRNGRNVALQEFREQNERQNDQCESGSCLPRHGSHGAGVRLTVGADELLCGKVCHHQRACDDNTREAVTCDEVTFLGVQSLVTRLVPGQNCYEDRE